MKGSPATTVLPSRFPVRLQSHAINRILAVSGHVGDPGILVDDEIVPLAAAGDEYWQGRRFQGCWISTLTRIMSCCESKCNRHDACGKHTVCH